MGICLRKSGQAKHSVLRSFGKQSDEFRRPVRHEGLPTNILKICCGLSTKRGIRYPSGIFFEESSPRALRRALFRRF